MKKITLSCGKEITVTQSNYRSLLADTEEAIDRKRIFQAAFKRYKDNRAAFASTYNLVLQQMAANYKSRNYESALDAALFRNNIPTSVFHNLKDAAYENTEHIKRYIALRKKHLKLDKYHTYDRFMKLAKDSTKYPLKPQETFSLRQLNIWILSLLIIKKMHLKTDLSMLILKKEKRTGAYSSGLYGFHPYILLNHDETLDSVFTLAHEAGHSAHTLFSNESQPMAMADYTIFVAEIASTFNEHILLDYLIQKSTTKEQKIDLLETALDGIMGTFFRQTLFATYEYEANKAC